MIFLFYLTFRGNRSQLPLSLHFFIDFGAQENYLCSGKLYLLSWNFQNFKFLFWNSLSLKKNQKSFLRSFFFHQLQCKNHFSHNKAKYKKNWNSRLYSDLQNKTKNQKKIRSYNIILIFKIWLCWNCKKNEWTFKTASKEWNNRKMKKWNRKM